MQALVLVALCAQPLFAAPLIHARDQAELDQALASIGPRGEIVLTGDVYEGLTLYDARHPFAAEYQDLVIRADDHGPPPTIRRMSLSGARNIRLSGVRFEPGPLTSTRDKPYQALRVSGLVIVDSAFVGPHGLDGDAAFGALGFGLVVRGATGLKLLNCAFRMFHRAVVISMSSDVQIVGSRFTEMSSDGVNLEEVADVTIAGNHFSDFAKPPGQTYHQDFLQLWSVNAKTPSRDILVEDNFFSSGRGDSTQSIFLRNERVDSYDGGDAMFYRDLTIRNNVIHNGHLHGITVGETVGLTIVGNTLVQNFREDEDRPVNTPAINIRRASRDVRIEGNILAKPLGPVEASWSAAGNRSLQMRDPLAPEYIGSALRNPLARGAAAPADFEVIDGGPGADVRRLAGARTPLLHIRAEIEGDGTGAFGLGDAASGGPAQAAAVWFVDGGEVGAGPTLRHRFSGAGRHTVAAEVDNARLERVVEVPPTKFVALEADATGLWDMSGFARAVEAPSGARVIATESGPAVEVGAAPLQVRGASPFLVYDEITLDMTFRLSKPLDEDVKLIAFPGHFTLFLGPRRGAIALATKEKGRWLRFNSFALAPDQWTRLSFTFSAKTGEALVRIGDRVYPFRGLAGAGLKGGRGADIVIGAAEEGQNLSISRFDLSRSFGLP